MDGLRLGIDMDGVIADFNAGWTWRYNRDFPGRVPREPTSDDVQEWDAPVGLTHFTTMGQFWNWARTCAEGRSLFYGLDPYPGAIEALHKLHDDGHEIVIVTTKPRFAIKDTHAWLRTHDVPAGEVHIVNDKTRVDCDVYLDDADHNVRDLVLGRPRAVTCRYVRPWNSPVPGALDVEEWDDFIVAVETLQQTRS
ncbi:MAG: hypothetical protein AAF467_08245 [Actinomycetota bacterium]